jgi:hypothetical protein
MPGGILIVLYPPLHPNTDAEGYRSAAWVPVHLTGYLGFLLTTFGLIGLLARQLPAAGRLGVLGFATAFIGTGLVLMEGREHTFMLPVLAAQATGGQPADPPGLRFLILSSALFSLGYIVLGIATLRAGVVPRGAPVLLAVGAPVLAFAPPTGIQAVGVLGGTLFGVGMLRLGFSLFAAAKDTSGTSPGVLPEQGGPRRG